LEYRYVISGSNILLVSILLFVIGYIFGDKILIGLSSSFMIIGIIFLSIGLTYAEPLKNFYSLSKKLYARLTNRIIEDLGLLTGMTIYACRSNDQSYIVYSKDIIKCENILEGIGISESKPYIAILFKLDDNEYAYIKSLELKQLIEQVFIYRYGLASTVNTRVNKDSIDIEFISVNNEIIEYLKQPGNIIHGLIPLYIMLNTDKNTYVIDEDIVGNNYIIKVGFLEEGSK
jgi:hypothetical protein